MGQLFGDSAQFLGAVVSGYNESLTYFHLSNRRSSWCLLCQEDARADLQSRRPTDHDFRHRHGSPSRPLQTRPRRRRHEVQRVRRSVS